MRRELLTNKAKKRLSGLPGNIRKSIAETVDGRLLFDPDFHLSGFSGCGGNAYGFRVGDCGMSYTKHDEELVAVAAGCRKDVDLALGRRKGAV